MSHDANSVYYREKYLKYKTKYMHTRSHTGQGGGALLDNILGCPGSDTSCGTFKNEEACGLNHPRCRWANNACETAEQVQSMAVNVEETARAETAAASQIASEANSIAASAPREETIESAEKLAEAAQTVASAAASARSAVKSVEQSVRVSGNTSTSVKEEVKS